MNKAPYQLFMLVLCVVAMGILAAQAILRRNPEVMTILHYADNAICVIFLGDFVLSFVRAPNRWKYMITWGWIDLLSSIPMLDAGRWGRLARVARIARVLRGVRATKFLSTLVLRHRSQSTFLAAILVALLLLFTASTAILHFESDPNANIKTANDAVWWSLTTITTVGYGDRYPVTAEGRLIAAILMTAGVALFGTFSAALAAWFLTPDERKADDDIQALRAEIAALREAIEKLSAR